MKRFMTALVAAMTIWGTVQVQPVHALSVTDGVRPQIKIELDGRAFETDPEPILYNNRTVVPFRALSEALGLTVEFDAATDTIHAYDKQVDVKMTLEQTTAYVNGNPVVLDAPPVLYQSRTMVPARFLSEAVGAQVGWDAERSTVLIASQQRDLHAMVFYGLNSYEKRGYLPLFDEASFTWSRVNAEGKLVFDESEYAWPTEGATELLNDVRKAEVERTLMIFSENANGELTRLLQDEKLQEQFADDLLRKLMEQGMDGAVLDLETLGRDGEDIEAVQAQYAAFVERVAKKLHEKERKLMVVASPLNGGYHGYDYKAMAAHADSIFVMAYSYIDDKLPQPVERIDEALRLALEEVPSGKLVLGISAYSETDATVQEKINLAKRYNLHGVGFWILRLFDDKFYQGVDAQLLMKGETTR